MNPKIIRLLAVWGLLGWTTADAIPIPVPPALTGSLTFTSTQGVYLQGSSVPLTIYNTTGLDFNDGDANDLPVVATNATVKLADGDFTPLLNTAARVRDFTFATPPGADYAVVTAGAFNFFITSVTIDVNAPWLRVFGDGYVEAAGYETTLGVFNLDVLASRTLTQVRGYNFLWETTSGVSAVAPLTLSSVVAVDEGVPVMELLALAGSVLTGGWFVVRRKRRRQSVPVLVVAQPVN